MNNVDTRDPFERMLRQALQADAERAPQLPTEWITPTTSNITDAWIDTPLVLVDSDDEQPGRHQRRPMWILLAAAVVIAVAGIALATNNKPQPPAPVATDSVAPPTTGATVSVAPTTTAATHTWSIDLADANNIRVTVTVPQGWGHCCDSSHIVPINSPGFDVRFDSVSNVYSDGCHMTPLDPPLGPTVDDLVTAWANMPQLAATAPVDITVDGYTGKQIELTVPDDVAACQRAETYGFGIWISNPSPGEPASDQGHYADANAHLRMLVLDVDGTRLLIAAITDPSLPEGWSTDSDATEQARTAFEEFLASGIQIDSAPGLS